MDSRHNFGGLIKEQRLSNHGKIEPGHGTLNPQENPMTCKPGTLTVDGGNCSDTKDKTSSTFKTKRYLMYLEVKILKDKKLSFGRDTMV
jgi:hypothetical protein